MEKIRVIRTDKREGLIRARVRGAEAARAEVWIFRMSTDVFREYIYMNDNM